jgi:diacylglycerol kinase (ATP)
MRRRFALVYNARAGIAVPRLLDGVLAALRAGGAEVFQIAARNAEDAAAQVATLAATDSADAVIAAGGDGTFRAVAAGAAGRMLPVGFVPLGTGNILAHEIGLTKRAADLARGLRDDPVIPVMGGLVNGAAFFLMCGAGFDGRIVGDLNYRAKRIAGRAAYSFPVTKALAAGAEVFDVDIDGKPFEASWIIVSNASHYGGSFTLTRATQLGAARMIATIVEARTRRQLLATSLALALGRLADPKTRPSFVKVMPANRVLIGQQIATRVEVDGDDAGLSPADVSAHGPVVQLIVPAGYVAGLTNRHTNHVL